MSESRTERVPLRWWIRGPSPQEMAELFSKRKFTRVEAVAYLAGVHDGNLLGSIGQYLGTEGGSPLLDRLKAAKEEFDAKRN